MILHISNFNICKNVKGTASSFSAPRSCCTDTGAGMVIRNQKLGTFTRIVKGDSFRIDSISNTGSSGSKGVSGALADVVAAFPPSRVLDFHVNALTNTQQLEFEWTAPGEDFDKG